jgi:hypothetical protein
MGVSGGRESSAGREGMDVKVSAISSSDGLATTHYRNGYIRCQASGEEMREQPIGPSPLAGAAPGATFSAGLTSETLSDLQMREAAPMGPKGASPRGEPRSCALA